MFSQTITIARNTFLESVRQPIYFVLIALCGVLQVFNTWGTGFSMGYTESGEVSGDNKLMFDIGMATVFVCGMLLAAFIATSVISREIENKTVLTVVSKPVSRTRLVFGKYLGAAAAMLIAVLTMLLFLQMGLRHEVLSTASDKVDQPVLLFSLLAVGLALGVGVWGNFFYGWQFTQTAALLLFPLMLLAWLLVLLLSKKWEWQPLGTDFKPQIAIAMVCLVMAQLVFTAAAVAASARLGQVMTIVVCAGLFVVGLLNNYFLGTRAIDNRFAARVLSAEPVARDHAPFNQPGHQFRITFEYEARTPVKVGSPVWYGPNPNGWAMAVPAFEPFDPAKVGESGALADREKPGALVVTAVEDKTITVYNAGAGLRVARPPGAGDYVFLRPTRVNRAALAAWGAVPNVQFFWLIDAVSQNQPIPASHVLRVGLYALFQIGFFLALAVFLFQTREVG